MRIEHQINQDTEDRYWKLYYESPTGKAIGADHDRNYPLFRVMAREWDLVQTLPSSIPSYLMHSPIVDHIRKYRTGSNQIVYVFSPYYDTRISVEEAHQKFMREIFKLNPHAFGVYYPWDSYYHPNTFTFVIKGWSGRRAHTLKEADLE